MESYNIPELVKSVKILLDRNRENSALVSDADEETLQQDSLIEPRISEATRMIELYAPLSMLGDADVLLIQNVDNYTFSEPILRLLGVRGEGWDRAAKLITPNDEEYSWQHSSYGVKGNKERPYCAVIEGGGNTTLEFFPSGNVDVMYLPTPKIEQGKISICKNCLDAILYASAALVSGAMGDSNGYTTMMAIANRMAGIQTLTDNQ